MHKGSVPQSDRSDNDSPDPAVPPNPDHAAPPSPPDPFDPAALRLSQDFTANLGVKKALITVPVDKPGKAWFSRVHPDPAYHLETYLIELKEERGESYLVSRDLWPELAGESTLVPRVLYTAVNRQGVLFLWKVGLPGPDGKENPWHKSLHEAARMAKEGWVRVTANMGLGGYDVFQATGDLPEPQWPELPFQQILRVAFKDRYIDALDHPVLRRLRGEV
jgi:hypothetical protein